MRADAALANALIGTIFGVFDAPTQFWPTPLQGRRLLRFGITPLARGEGGPVRFFKTVRNRAQRFDFSVRHRQRVEEAVQIFPQDDRALSKFSDRELPGRDGFVKPRASEAPGVAGLINGEAAFFGTKSLASLSSPSTPARIVADDGS